MFAAARSTPSPSAAKPVVWECFRLFGAERDVKNALALVRAPVTRVSSEGQCALGLLAFLPPAACMRFPPVIFYAKPTSIMTSPS